MDDNIIDIKIGDGDNLHITVEHTYPIDNDEDPYTVYEIRIDHKSDTFHRVWRIYKRFAAIYDFEKKVHPLSTIPEDITLKKKLLGKNMDPTFVKQRTQEIQTCFNAITSDAFARRSVLLKEFLNPQISPAISQVSAFHVIKEGYVLIERKLATGINSLKLNKFISICSWKRKWCVITSDMPWLYIFNTREDFTLPSIALDLRTCTVEVCPPKLSENGTPMYCFAVSVLKDGTKTKTITVRAETLDELTLWNAAISDLVFAKRTAPPFSFSANVLSKENFSEPSSRRITHSNSANSITMHCETPSKSYGYTGGGGERAPPIPGKQDSSYLQRSGQMNHHLSLSENPPPVPQRPHQNLSPSHHTPPQRPLPKIMPKTPLGTSRKLPPLRSKSQSKMGFDENNLGTNSPSEQEPFQVIDEDDEDEILYHQQHKGGQKNQSRQLRQSIVISNADIIGLKSTPVKYSAEDVILPDKELVPGETITLKIPNIYHVHISESSTQDPSVKPLATCILGTIFLTNYKLVFKPVQGPSVKSEIPIKTFESCPCCTAGCSVPIAGIQEIDRFHGVSPAYGRFSCFVIRSKNLHDIRFNYVSGSVTPSSLTSPQNESEVTSANEEPFPDDLLEPHIFHNYILNLFAFNKKWVDSFDSYMVYKFWNIYDQSRELARLGFPGKNWRITEINKKFAYCDTYPELLCVPAQITDQELIPMFSFRSKGRIPTVIWANKDTGTALLRCSQPSVGVKSKRCLEDEKLMDSIGACNSMCKTVFILDARPRLNARANQFMGRGFEHDKFYANCSISFLGIDNIHKVSEGEAKIRKAVATPGGDFRAQSSRWLQYISLLIESAVDVVTRIGKGISVIIHCSDGWDRTPQLTSLSLLLLDPYYRTLGGFIVLIEKEWISFGHKFAQRTRQVPTKEPSSEQSPIFMQFIDCIRQMIELCPNAFQFNEGLLMTILNELYAGRFGTFLFDSLAKRKAGKAEETTVPLWLFVEQNKQSYINRSYDPGMDLFHTLQAYKRIPATLWEAYFTKWKHRHTSDLGVPLRSTWREDLL